MLYQFEYVYTGELYVLKLYAGKRLRQTFAMHVSYL
jgi:hypothetical protein